MLEDVGKLTDRASCINMKENPEATRVYRTLILPLPKDDPDWSNEASYSQRSPAGRVLECLPTKEGAQNGALMRTYVCKRMHAHETYCRELKVWKVVLSCTRTHVSVGFVRNAQGALALANEVCAGAGNQVGLVLYKADDEEVNNLSTPEESAAFLKSEFPGLFPIIPQSEIDAFATRAPGKLPFFKYAGPDLHCEDKIVLIGDVIHTVKPYFGLGVNSALNDVTVLKQKLEAHPVRLFTMCRSSVARAVVAGESARSPPSWHSTLRH